MAAVTSHAEARTFCATIFGNALYEDRLPPRFLVASYVGVDPDRPRGPYPPSLLRLHPARDHALGTPATRLDLAPWRADEPQLRRIVAAVGPTLVDLDLASAVAPCGGPAASCVAPWTWPRHKRASTTATSPTTRACAPSPSRRRTTGATAGGRSGCGGLARCGAVTTAGVAGVVHATLHSLEALDLAENPQLDEAVVLALRDPLRPARLATIDLSGLAALGDGGVAVVVRCCPGLEVVEGEIACLAMRPALTALDLGDTAARRECARWAAGCCPALRALRLATCGPLEDEGLLALAVNPALALESLDVSGCHLLGRDGGKAFYELAYRHGDSLECLDLRHVPLLAPHVVAQILDDCTFLRQLRLDGTQAPSEACFGGAEGAELALAQAKEGLRAAAFRPSGGVGAPDSGGMSRNAAANSAFLTDASLYAIGEHLPRLETLDLSQHPFLTALGWAGFENPRLRVLKMTGCAALEVRGCRWSPNSRRTSRTLTRRAARGAEDVRRVFGANAYATSHEGDVAIRPNRDAAAIERRDAAYAAAPRGLVRDVDLLRLALFQLTHRIRRRIAGAVVKRAVVEYRARRRDAFRQHFKRLVNYRRIIARWSAIRLQRCVRRWLVARGIRACVRIQRCYRSRRAKWLVDMLTMINGSVTLIARVWRGKKTRTDLPPPRSGAARPRAGPTSSARLWPEPRGRVFEETVADFDPKAATYEARAKMVEKTAAAALSGGELAPELGKGGDSKDADYADGKAEQSRRTPWSMANLQSADSLLPTLAAANLAQMKQTLILDRAKNETEARQIEEAKRLEQALEEAEEEARQQAAAAALVSEEENQAVTDMRENRATMLEEREKARVGKAATAIQKLERALSVRRDFDDRDIGVGTCCGLREVVQEEYAVVEYGEPPQPSLVSRRGRGRHAPGSEGEQENKAKIQIRVHADFQIRRSYERKAALFERASSGQAEHDKLADLELANDCVGKALQAMIVAYLSAESEKTQAPAKVPEAWDVAMRGVAARRKHLTYAVDALEKAQWWGVEAVRCHYRRHRACALSMSTAANRLRWLDRECALIGKLRAFLRQRREMAPDSIHQKYYVAWLDSQLERLASMFVALDSEQEHVVARDLGQMRACMETALGSEAILDEMVQDLRADYKCDGEGPGAEKLVDIQAVLRNPPKIHGHFDREKWLDVFRSQPWLAQQEVEEAKRRETFDKKKMQLAQMAGIVEQKREDMVKESAELDALEAAMLENERVRDAADSTRDAREAAATFLEVNAGVLAEKRADHARREALEKLEGTLAEFTREMGAEEKEAHDRLAAARAKAEFDGGEMAADDGDDADAIDAMEERSKGLEEVEAIDRELKSMKERSERRKVMTEAVEAEATEEARKDEQAAKEEAALQLEREQAAELKAAGALAAMGLVDPSLKKRKGPLREAYKEAKHRARRAVFGADSVAAEQQESNHMMQSIMRRQKLKMGAATAIRSIRFTVGKEETDAFKEKQEQFAADSLPHYIRVKKTIGLHTQIAIWIEPSADQDEFLTDVQIAHSSPENEFYKDLSQRGYAAYTRSSRRRGSDPGFVIWGKKRKDAVFVVASIEVTSTNFNFGDMFLWVKKINRNAEAENDNESIFHELRATRKEIRKRPDDPILVQREKGLKARLEKVKEYADYRDAFKEDPLKYAIEFMAITQSELERWMDHFTAMDTEHIGGISPKQVLEYLGFRDTRFMYAAFALLGEPADGTLMDFGETALREIELFDDGKLTYEEFLETDKNFPNLFYPLFEAQNLMRQKFFGTRYWTRKLQKYTKIKAQLREERQNNTDKMAAAGACKLAAQNTQSIVKRSLLTARIYALQFAQKHDKKKKKFGRVKNLPGAIK
ncbi:hypothetical protein JL722_4441 [Aureococcus anophagefferens]|nr:hypothetical protein JL722_4441 [Aureococcus anophagefferens]